MKNEKKKRKEKGDKWDQSISFGPRLLAVDL